MKTLIVTSQEGSTTAYSAVEVTHEYLHGGVLVERIQDAVRAWADENPLTVTAAGMEIPLLWCEVTDLLLGYPTCWPDGMTAVVKIKQDIQIVNAEGDL